MFLRSRSVYRDVLRYPNQAWLLPIARGGQHFETREGSSLYLPRRYWTMLPTACRLVAAGAAPKWLTDAEWREDVLQIQYRGLAIHAPPFDKSIGSTLREIFVDDAYGVRGADLSGQVVLDVGAYIGDSALAFAAAGAQVHAFEPVPLLQRYLRRNVECNGFTSQVTVHGVGLSDRAETLDIDINLTGLAGVTAQGAHGRTRATGKFQRARIELVEAAGYLRSSGIERCNILKLDCEGCEYRMLGEGGILDALRPSRIILEYHRGGDVLHEALVARGYRVDWSERTTPHGYMTALLESN